MLSNISLLWGMSRCVVTYLQSRGRAPLLTEWKLLLGEFLAAPFLLPFLGTEGQKSSPNWEGGNDLPPEVSFAIVNADVQDSGLTCFERFDSMTTV